MRYITTSGAISDEGCDAILDAISSAMRVAEEEGIEELLPFATSAIREATNGPALLARIREQTGVDLQVLSGADEARLTAAFGEPYTEYTTRVPRWLPRPPA